VLRHAEMHEVELFRHSVAQFHLERIELLDVRSVAAWRADRWSELLALPELAGLTGLHFSYINQNAAWVAQLAQHWPRLQTLVMVLPQHGGFRSDFFPSLPHHFPALTEFGIADRETEPLDCGILQLLECRSLRRLSLQRLHSDAWLPLLCSSSFQQLHHLSLTQVYSWRTFRKHMLLKWELVLANLRELRSLQLCEVSGADKWINLLMIPSNARGGDGGSSAAPSIVLFLCPHLHELSFRLFDPELPRCPLADKSLGSSIPSARVLAALARTRPRPALSIRVSMPSLPEFEAGLVRHLETRGRQLDLSPTVDEWRAASAAYSKLQSSGRITVESRLSELM